MKPAYSARKQEPLLRALHDAVVSGLVSDLQEIMEALIRRVSGSHLEVQDGQDWQLTLASIHAKNAPSIWQESFFH